MYSLPLLLLVDWYAVRAVLFPSVSSTHLNRRVTCVHTSLPSTVSSMSCLHTHTTPHTHTIQGTLAKLDTANPVLYIEFPQGRLKLLGTLVFPRNKYMVLRPGSKEVLAEDVLESMVCIWGGVSYGVGAV